MSLIVAWYETVGRGVGASWSESCEFHTAVTRRLYAGCVRVLRLLPGGYPCDACCSASHYSYLPAIELRIGTPCSSDRALSDKTASLGMVGGFVPAFDNGAAYLYPGAPLLRGSDHIRAFLEGTDSIVRQTYAPVFADVSADGRLGYSYGWTRSSGARGKYLACWQKTHEAWRLAAFASSRPVPVPDSVALPP